MEEIETKNHINDVYDAFQNLHTDPFHPDSKETEKIITSIHDSIMASHSTRELYDVSQEYVNLFQEWNDTVRKGDVDGLFDQGLDDPFFSDEEYIAFHHFNSVIPDMIFKCVAVRAYELMKKNGITTSLYSLLSLLEDMVNESFLTGGDFDSNRSIIHKAMITKRSNIHNTDTIDADQTDSEITKIRKLQKELLSLDIILDDEKVTGINLLNFRLLFDPVGYTQFLARLHIKQNI